MKIKTVANFYGGLYPWTAIDDDTYDGAEDSTNRHMIGCGRTEKEAIEDLKRLIQEKEECDDQR